MRPDKAKNNWLKISYSGDQETTRETPATDTLDDIKETVGRWQQIAKDRKNWKIQGGSISRSGRGKTVEEVEKKKTKTIKMSLWVEMSLEYIQHYDWGIRR